MAMSVGAIEARLRVNIAQFQQGLRDGAQEGARRAAELTKSLHIKARLDHTPLTQGLHQAMRGTAAAMAGLLGRLRQGAQQTQGFGAALQRAGTLGAAAFRSLATGAGHATTALGRTLASLARVDVQTGRLSQSVHQLANLWPLLSSAAAALGVGRLATSAIDTASSFENLETRLISLTGSLERTRQATAWIATFTADTPLELDEVSKAFVNLTAVGLDATKILPGLTEGVSAFGKGGEALDRVVYQIGQMIGKNRVLMEDLGVITDAIPASLQVIQRELGLTDAQLQDLSTSGLSVKQVVEGLATGLQRQFAGSAQAMSRTWTGIMSNIRDTWTQMQKTLMDAGLFDFLKAGADLFRARMVQALQDNAAEAKRWASTTIDAIKLVMRVAAQLIDLLSVDPGSAWAFDLKGRLESTRKELEAINTLRQKLVAWWTGQAPEAGQAAGAAAMGTATATVEQLLQDVDAKLAAFQQGKQAQAGRSRPVAPATDKPMVNTDAESTALKGLSDAWRAFQAEHQRAREVLAAQGELRLAQLTRERAGEETILQAKRDQQLAVIALEQTQLRSQESWLKAQKTLDQEALRDLQARQQLLGLEAQIVSLTTQEATQRAQIARALEVSAARASLQDAILQRQLDLEGQRLELDQIHVRLLGLAPEQEQLLLTVIQAERHERMALAELDRGRQKAAELAADFATKLRQTEADQLEALTTAYATQQTAIDGANARLLRQFDLLQALKDEASQLAKSAPFQAAAADLAGIVRDFQSSLAEGALDIAQTVRNVGQTFIDVAMRPAFEAMQKSLAKMLESISDQLGGYGGLVMAGIGVALTAISTAFQDMRATTESLGEQAANSIDSVQKQRGLIAGDSSIPIQQISQSLSQAMRRTEALIAEGNRYLAAIAGQGGSSQGTAAAASYGTALSSEVLGAARL